MLTRKKLSRLQKLKLENRIVKHKGVNPQCGQHIPLQQDVYILIAQVLRVGHGIGARMANLKRMGKVAPILAIA